MTSTLANRQEIRRIARGLDPKGQWSKDALDELELHIKDLASLASEITIEDGLHRVSTGHVRRALESFKQGGCK